MSKKQLENSHSETESDSIDKESPSDFLPFGKAFGRVVKNSILISLVHIINTITKNFSFSFLKGQSDNNITAAYGIGNTFLTIFCVAFVVSLNVGMLVESSQNHGLRNFREMGYLLHRAIIINIILLIPLTLLIIFSEDLFILINFEAKLAHSVGSFMVLCLPGIWTYMIFSTMNFYLNAAKIFKPQTVIQCINSIIYIVVAYLFILKYDMGLNGAAYAFNIMNIMNSIVLFVFIYASDPIPGSFFWYDRQSFRGIGAQFKSEVILGVAMLAGWIGEEIFAFVSGSAGADESAAFMTVIASWSICQTLRIGSNDTSATFFGNSVGENQPGKFKTYAKANLTYACIYSVLCSLVFLFLAEPLVRLYTTDETVVHKGIFVSRWLAISLIGDGFNSALSILLRSLGHEKALLIVSIIAAFIIGTPSGIVLCLPVGLGAIGLAIGYNITAWSLLLGDALYFFIKVDVTKDCELMHKKTVEAEEKRQAALRLEYDVEDQAPLISTYDEQDRLGNA